MVLNLRRPQRDKQGSCTTVAIVCSPVTVEYRGKYNMEVTSRRKHPFYIVDNAVLDIFGPQLKPNGIAVYNALCRYADCDLTCYPSIQAIAKKIGASRSTVIRAIQKLVSLGLVEVEKRYSPNGDKDSNLYILLDVDPVEALDLALTPKSISDTTLVSERNIS